MIAIGVVENYAWSVKIYNGANNRPNQLAEMLYEAAEITPDTIIIADENEMKQVYHVGADY